MGLDLGKKHVGVAISIGSFAEPYDTIDIKQLELFLRQDAQKHSLSGLIVGITGEETAQDLEQFKQRFEGLLKTIVYFQDETLSSHDARQMLLHKSKSYRRNNEHAISAAVILQRWLDSR